MSERSALQWLRAPRLAEDALPPDSLAVQCRSCGRSVQVSMSPMRPPSFLQVRDQVECPEVQERWAANGERGLLLLMCGALERSLEADREEQEADAAALPDPAPIVAPVHPRSAPERTEAEPRTDERNDAGRNGRMSSRPENSEERRSWSIRAIVGLCFLAMVALGSILLPLRGMKILSHYLPGLNGLSRQQQTGLFGRDLLQRDLLQRDLLQRDSFGAPSSGVRQVTAEAATGAPSVTPEIPPGARPLSRPLGMQPQPAALETTPGPATEPATPSQPTAPLQTAAAQPAAEPKPRAPEMVQIAGGTFAMGGDDDTEQPVHQVSVQPFVLSKYPVTVGEWKQCVAAARCADIASDPDDRPVTNVSYEDTQAYLAWLSKAAGKSFRLPTEAEWEYAARGGQRTRYWWGDRIRRGMISCKGCNENDTAEAELPPKVGSFQPNPFGLFDMGGEVGQWVADNWHKNYKGAPADGTAWLEEGSNARVIRSGSWKNGPADARAGSRDRYDGRIRHPTLGFRVALSL